jgi:TRAP-type uncharacterized transport system substrate-binding protein
MAAVSTSATRSQLVLEIAAELVAGDDRSIRQAKVSLREDAGAGWALTLLGSSTTESVHEVVSGAVDLAMVNPCAALVMAYKGRPPFPAPQPVRQIAVIPSLDQMVFAVRGDLGLASFEDIGRKRLPLKVSMRGQRDHCIHDVMDEIMRAAGFSRTDVEGWGGEFRKEGAGGPPRPGSPKLKAVLHGDIDAIFDEASDLWLEAALDAGLTILPLSEATMRTLEGIGYRRGILDNARFPRLPHDLVSFDFSGWPVFVSAALPDQRVRQICAALDARKHLIGWQSEGPLPVERMAREAPDTPQQVPLHPAAEAFWRERGYL